MQATLPQSQRLSDYTRIPVEVFIVALTILPFLILIYFYPQLSERVPLFMTFSGEVSVWGEKTWLSVFRVPLLAVVTQVFCLVTKYGVLKTEVAVPVDDGGDYLRLYKQSCLLTAGLWDWFRCIAALKMSAETFDTVFLSIDRLKFLSRPTFVITLVVSLLSIPIVLYYAYRLITLRRKIKGRVADTRKIDASSVYGSILYFNRSDSALFVSRYIFNFANVWAWVFLGCIIAYALLVFLPG
jgi:uncharacterized membrane protein